MWLLAQVLDVLSRGHGIIVINLHRIVLDSDRYLPKAACVHTPAAVLEEFLALGVKYFDFLSLDDLVFRLQNNVLLSRPAIALTFDDGFLDNKTVALEILRKHQVPATFFISVDAINSGQILPMDAIAQALLDTKQEVIELSFLEHPLSLCGFPERIAANNSLGQAVKSLPLEKQHDALKEILLVTMTKESDFPSLMMTWREVKELAMAGMTIGSHGMSHSIMSKLPFACAVNELKCSKQIIEKEIDLVVHHFAFPNGNPQDFSFELHQEAMLLGYSSVSSCSSGMHWIGEQFVGQINRVGIGENARETYARITRFFVRRRMREMLA